MIDNCLEVDEHRFLYCLAPWAAKYGGVYLVCRHGVLATFRYVLGDGLRCALCLQADVRVHVVNFIVVLVFFAGVRASYRFAGAGRVDSFCRFHAGEELVGRTFGDLRQASVNGGSRLLARDRRSLLQAGFYYEVVVGLQVACDEGGCDIYFLACAMDFFQGKVPRFVSHVYAAGNMFVVCFVSGLLTGNARCLCPLCKGFKSSAIAYWCYGFGVRIGW